jgi:hypothetical protein
MVNKAITVENKIKEMEKNGKNKMLFPGQSSGSNTRPRMLQPVPFFRDPSVVRSLMHGQRPPCTTPKLLDAEASTASTSTQCATTVSP